MKPARSLTLRSESLRDLTVEELSVVAGAAAHTSPLFACVSDILTGCAFPSDPFCLISELAC